MRGVSLEEIAFDTKISLRFLEAIEREDFKKLPGGIFGRSFVRTYARYLGLDEDRVLAEFQAAASPQTDMDLHRMPGNRSGAPPSKTPVLATIVAVIMLIGGYQLFRYSRRAAEMPVPPAPIVVEPPPAHRCNRLSLPTRMLPGPVRLLRRRLIRRALSRVVRLRTLRVHPPRGKSILSRRSPQP